MADPKYAVVDGKIVPWNDAKVHVASAGFKFGTAVFEGIRGYWNPEDDDIYLFRMAEHMRRLSFSQAFMRFDEIIAPEAVTDLTLELIRANECRGENLHIMTTTYISGHGGPGVLGPVGLSITVLERGRTERVLNGVTAQVSSWMRVPDNAMPMRVKCNANYNNGRLATVQAVADGYDTAIFLNNRGKVSEGPGQCLFIIRDGQVITPSITNDILESITRDSVLTLLTEDLGLTPVERDVDRSELAMADEAFFCGTAWEVAPILAIDKVNIGDGTPGPITRKLQQAYFDVCAGTNGAGRPEWRMPVYGTAAKKAAE